MSISPVRDLIVLSPVKQENKTTSGIILSDKTSPAQERGKVINVGPDVKYVNIGDTVIPDWSKGSAVTHSGAAYVLISEDHILGILEGN